MSRNPTVSADSLLRQDVALDSLNTLRLPARAAWFAAVDDVDGLRAVLDDPRVAGLPRLVIGGGSNLVLTGDFPGLVLHFLPVLFRSRAAHRTAGVVRGSSMHARRD